MSLSGEELECKAGHPPAVKAGGMRITQHKTPKEERPEPKLTKEEQKEMKNAPNTAGPLKQPSPPLIVPSLKTKETENPVEALKVFHEKPVPTHEARASHTKPNVIHQPRK